ncbi:hypothetical protein [Paenibacillus sp. Soil724D2]|uniref:hypothetical protein n=1 Tax=Paenibacillus sp. (strain Soil724D2) TaxID=1736392 RepID=UPI000716393B|nr:hypothetical protein [Paenibacillus sp. Soil724D2]KRE41773.1 hypothetical protein ASG85_33985 [Paenibacillus sp. Soil724D2]
MTHYNEQAWKQYVEERLSPDTLSEMELHLYQCDECLTMYMTCLEQMEAILPIMEKDTQGYVDAIIARTTGTKRSWYHSTMLHYGIAAAATLILVATGFFHGISQELDSVGTFKPTNSINTSSSLQTDKPISDQLLNKTLTWLDTLQNK